MNLKIHSLCLAAILAGTNSAFAYDYYLQKKDESYTSPSQFTKIDELSKNGTSTYMLMFERFEAESWGKYYYQIYRTDDNNDKVYFGPAEDTTVSGTEITNGESNHGYYTMNGKEIAKTDYEGKTIAISQNSNSLSSDQSDIAKHLLLTLTVNDEDGSVTSLNIKHPTEYNIPVNLPTFFYIDNNNWQKLTPLVKTGDFTYSAHLDKITNGMCLFIKDYSKNTCINLGQRVHTKISIGSGGKIHISKAYKEGNTISSVDGYLNFDLYQGSNGIAAPQGINFETTFYDVDITFTYDMLFRTGEENLPYTKPSDVLTNPNGVTASYEINNPENKTMFEMTESMYKSEDQNNYTIQELAKASANSYNGQLQIRYASSDLEVNEIKNGEASTSFIVKTSNDSWSENGEIKMTYTEEYTVSDADDQFEAGNYLVFESSTLSEDFDAAFYIQQLISAEDGDVTTTSVSYKGDSTDTTGEKTFAQENGEEDEDATQSIVGFSPENTTYVSTTSTSDSMPFYLQLSSSNSSAAGTKIVFYYNYENPSKSVVKVVTDSTVVTGINSTIADIENAPVEYYNLNGVRVNATTPGIYIRRQGSQVSKVVVK